MRLLVIGKSGQLARALATAALPGTDWQSTALGRPELDITDAASVRAAVAAHAPDIVVNAAAYTAVDRAEAEPQAALAVNRDGARFVAEAAAAAGAPVIHVSTDYVFSGDGDRPYVETDPVAPLGAYGQSKLAGEQAVAGANSRHLVLRTAWVYSPWGSNFARTMLRLGAERDELRVVDDQTGTPTYAPDLADAIIAVAARAARLAPGSDDWGTYHLTNAGVTTWYGFAGEIFRLAAESARPTPALVPITTAEYPTPARRPHYSVLDNGKIADAFGIRLRDWREATAECVRRLLAASPDA